jgi:HlyD family secretion protein
VLGVPISAVVVKTDTTATKKIPADEETETVKVIGKSEKKYECVFVKRANKAKLVVIKTGIQDDTNIEVAEGLKKGDVVITGPYTTVTRELNSGDKIVISKEASKASETKK